MPQFAPRLIAVVTLLAFLCANSYGLCHARHAPCHCTDGAVHAAHAECDCDQCSDEPDSNSPKDDQKDSDPADSSCPCPGGCALCSVAKVPCLPPLMQPADAAPCVDDGPGETAPAYDPPFRATLTPPPKA